MPISRRGFLKGDPSANNHSNPIRLPWVKNEDLFVNQCSSCSDCVAACPEKIIVIDASGYPKIDFNKGECTFCGDCVNSCTEPLFTNMDSPPWDITATINEQCLAFKGVVCQSCKDMCPTAAISMQLTIGNAPKPVINIVDCTGCGACVAPCPSQAITLQSPLAIKTE